MARGYVYMLASKKNGTLYTGVTNDLIRRVAEHKQGTVKGFTARYQVKMLVYYEGYDRFYDAISREKCIKEWKRAWKVKLIEEANPSWDDLSLGLTP
ncbi:MAG: GIY-YIG nuclease family protein [Alphaproteobacteria bacterium]|nr:GIY-YIG nuclease family protein [Alphaproteobacteria bacterium]